MNILEKIINFQFSVKAKEAIKVGLAFSLVIAISLKFGWLNPFWAGFAVGQIALYPAGQSLRNGALRVAGVIPAVLVSLVIYSLAPQERWLFIALTSAWMMFATYMMIKDEKHSYLWNVAGFAALAILATHPDSSASIFETAIARGLDTTLGIIVYTLVTVFIWPETNISRLKQVSTGLVSTQAKIFSLMDYQAKTTSSKNSLKELVQRELQLLGALKQSFFAKGSESYQVQEAAEFWKEFYRLSLQLQQSFNRLDNSFMGLTKIDVLKITPGLNKYKEEINKRFEITGALLSNGTKKLNIEVLKLKVDKNYLKSLSPFEQLAFSSSKKEFEKIESLSRAIIECANNIVDDSVSKKITGIKPVKNIYERLTIDIDHLNGAFFVGFITFASFCLWIFFDPPGGMVWMQLPPTVAMIVAIMPQMKTNKMVLPSFFVLTFFLMIYIYVMPQLSGIVELSILLFLSMFGVFYFLNGTYKILGTIAVITKLQVHNEQVYNFAASANMVIFTVFGYAFIYALSYIMSSPRPQRAFLSHIRRYFRSAEFLVSDVKYKNQKSIFDKFKITFYKYELRTLPIKIKAWSIAIDHKHFPDNSQNDIDELLTNFLSLSNSIDEWLTSNYLNQTKLILPETIEELSKWDKGIENVFSTYCNDLDSPVSSQIKDSYVSHVHTLETIVNKNTKRIKLLEITADEKENFYRLVGSYQGLSLSLISYATAAEQINWNHWEEEVFA